MARPRTRGRAAGGTARASPLLVLVVALIAAGTLIPVGFVVDAAVRLGLSELAALVLRPRVGELLANTLLLLVVALPACVAIGVAGAVIVERTSLPGRRLWTVVLVAPLAVPAFVSGYAWVSVVPAFGGAAGGVLVAVLAYSPLVTLPCLAALRGLDPELEDTARSLGLGQLAVLTRVVLPQLRPAVIGGGLLVGLHLLAEYGAFSLIRFDTFTTAIVVQFQSTFAGAAANALGIVLTGLSLLLVSAEAGIRGRARYVRLGSGVLRPRSPSPLPRPVVLLVQAALLMLSTLALGVPLGTVARWLLAGSWWQQQALPQAVVQTVAFALLGALVTIAAAMPVAWLTTRHRGRVARMLEAATLLSSSLPSIIVALALVTVTLRVLPFAYQTLGTVLTAYLILFFPRALVSLRAALVQAPELQEEVARSLGRSPLAARAAVTLPVALPGILAGGALVALGAAGELTSTLLLAPSGTRTLATEFWTQSTAVHYSDAAPYAALLVLFSIPAVALLLRQVAAGSSR